MANIRTTIVLPEEDVKHIKMLAVLHGLTMSQVIQESVKHVGNILSKKHLGKKSNVGWRAVMGSLNLGGKEPPSRQELYDRYLDEKLHR